MAEKKAYYKRLDIVRGLSCIMVLLYHLNLLKGGFLAVCTFFTLSGYLECTSAMKNRDFSLKKFYTNRLKKIYFPLIVVVCITVILTKIITSINWINLREETSSVVFGYNNFWQLKANLDYFTRNIASPFMHLWYISILMQFDLVFPLFVTLFKKINRGKRKSISTFVVGACTLAFTVLFFVMSKKQDIMVVYYNTFKRVFSLLFGVFIALLNNNYEFKFSRIFGKNDKITFTIYMVALIALSIFVSAESSNYAIYMILATIISAGLIECSIKESKKTRKYDKQIKGLAKISYEVYLVQYPVIFFLQNTPINDFFKIVFTIILTFITGYIIQLLINFSIKNKITKYLKIAIVIAIIAGGSYFVINEKDHSEEMKALENKLSENLKITEERNNQFLENTNTEEEKKEETVKASSEEVIDESKIDEIVTNLPVVGIGDSVLLTPIGDLYTTFPKGYFDGKISRAIPGGIEVAKTLKSKGKLTNTVILCLSTNGIFNESKLDELMEIMEDREIYWINAVGADDPKFNQKFASYASNHPNIHIVTWDQTVKSHPEYLEPDKIHPNYKGGKAMVKLIYDTIHDVYLQKAKAGKTKV